MGSASLSLLRRNLLLLALLALAAVLGAVDQSFMLRFPGLVDWGAIALILAVMYASTGLVKSGFVDWAAGRIFSSAAFPRRGIALTLLLSALLSSLTMNDASLFVLAPVAVEVSDLYNLDPAIMIAMLAASVNLGSSISPVGNPQNIIIWRYYDLSVSAFLAWSLPSVLPLLAVTVLYSTLLVPGGESARHAAPPRCRLRKGLALASVIMVAASVILADSGMPFAAVLLAVALYAALEPSVLTRSDYSLLAIIALMYADFREIASLVTLPASGGLQLLVEAAVISQAISNVPTALLLLGSPWKPLFLGVSVGGLGLLTGSLANIIALRVSRVSLSRYHKYSIPLFLVILLASALELAF